MKARPQKKDPSILSATYWNVLKKSAKQILDSLLICSQNLEIKFFTINLCQKIYIYKI